MKFSKFRKSWLKMYRRLRCTWAGGERMLILGDSHAGVFEYIFDHDLFPPHLINCDIVGGATAYGLNNDNSVTGAFRKFRSALQRFPDYRHVGIMLGEVDCSFALWNRAMRDNTPAVEQIPRAIEGIERLLDWGAENFPTRKFVLFGAILPTIKDHQISRQSFELRRQIAATQRERTELVLAFNRALRAVANKRAISYLDITEATLDPLSGVVRDEFLVDEGIDHHQSQAKTANLWIAQLSRLFAVGVGEK